MELSERAAVVQKILEAYFPDPQIPLEHSDPYTLLIAVLLSAQTTDRQVNKVTDQLFEKAATPQKMALLEVSEIEQTIKSCGLAPTKAKAIRALSQQLVDKHNGKVPDNFKDLEALPGVGHKTASVVLVQAFAHPAFPVDTHIERCARRWGLSEGKNVKEVEKGLKSLYPPHQWGTLHLQMIYFARRYCPAKNHDPQQCPMCSKLSGYTIHQK
ncbi:MAG: endonuclease III [Chlamydiota bacterium]